MFKSIGFRASLVGLAALAALIFLFPTLSPTLPAWWKGVLPEDKVHLGLDLKGGMHLVLEVEAEKAVESTLDGIKSDLRTLFRKEGVNYLEIERKGFEILAFFPDESMRIKAEALFDRHYPRLVIDYDKGRRDEVVAHISLRDREVEGVIDYAVRQGVETIRNRIDQFGVSEPVIQRKGDKSILVQLPGIEDPKRAKDLIGRTARLEFKLVDDRELSREEIWGLISQAEGEHPGISDDHEAMNEWLQGKIPEGRMVLFQRAKDPETGRTRKEPFLLDSRTMLSGDTLRDAGVRLDRQFGTPYVAISFNSSGSRVFEQVTGEHVNERLAIILDNNVYSAPVIKERIPGGQAQITGRFTMEEATDLAIVLRAGALPAPVRIEEERTVGPSLGRDSIHRGAQAMAAGIVLVFVFMIVYYRIGGLIADITLVFNLLFIMGALAGLRATLTFPGIAGLILTVGMAVDASILILERMREEMRLGKTPRAVVEAGFSRAMLTIVDANLTTLVAALVLFQFGTGPIRGFAVTLSLGIISTLFSSLVLGRLIFDYLYSRGIARTLYV